MADTKTTVGGTLNNPTQSLAEILATLQQNTPAINDSYVQPEYTNVIDPTLYNVSDLSKVLGLDFTYDRNEIEKIYQDATKASYLAEANSGAERSYYSNLANAQNTALDTIKQQYGQAVATGANKGMQAANMLSAVLGTTQTANDEATALAEGKQKLANTYAAQLKQDAADALSYSNDVANSIGSLTHSLYNDQIQQLTAQLAYNQGINTDAAGYAANKYTAQSNLAGTLASAGAGVYNNNQSAIAQLQAAIEAANAQRYAADKGQYQKIEYSGGYSVK
jgi:hypothetical protein